MSYQNMDYALKLCDYTHSSFPDLPLQYLRCLIIVSCNEGISISDISQKIGSPLSTTSRIISALENRRQMGEAYNLLQIDLNPFDNRQKLISLSPKGRNFICQLDKAMA